ncbi:uncharacterized protein DNG_05747 [Cephalotrichum gorgonifer]|uniref:Uncharacterized protein n=1 Tax=Cephalotrichum gorgonifer TaxID=2041049 RepID=A0AAE8MYD7_9PEZI|nr:uncharacterized protein DNG_05747 [Cephalotrichum gorgonifer]
MTSESAPAAPSQPPPLQASSDSPQRIPRAVILCRRAYSTAERALHSCPYHGIRYMAKVLWTVRQLPLEKYGEWKRERRRLSRVELMEFRFFIKLWNFLYEMDLNPYEPESDAREVIYWEVLDEFERRCQCGFTRSDFRKDSASGKRNDAGPEGSELM